MFGANEKDVKKGFKAVKADMVTFKDSMNEWIMFLNENQREMKEKLAALERRLNRLELRELEDISNSDDREMKVELF